MRLVRGLEKVEEFVMLVSLAMVVDVFSAIGASDWGSDIDFHNGLR
jgi:hypothetical protein